MKKTYEEPTVEALGTVEDLTAQSQDKIGSAADSLTPQNPGLDGDFVPDGA